MEMVNTSSGDEESQNLCYQLMQVMAVYSAPRINEDIKIVTFSLELSTTAQALLS